MRVSFLVILILFSPWCRCSFSRPVLASGGLHSLPLCSAWWRVWEKCKVDKYGPYYSHLPRI